MKVNQDMTPEILITGTMAAANVAAVVVAAMRIVAAGKKNTLATEQRLSDQINRLDIRAATLETKVERAENDIQKIFAVMPKRNTDQ